ncbi:hypothetical protein ES703_65201 [subsurface metagenome]
MEGYVKWRKKKEQTLKQLKEIGIGETDAASVGDEIYVAVGEISKLNLDSLVKAKAKCAFTVHGRLYIEEFEGWANGYGTFYCTEEELEKHI